jgi:metal-responsive CopG/Arc/MetJ family transcriptional regulator
MAKPSVSMPDEMLEDLDDAIEQLKLKEELDLNTSRSEVIQDLVEDWLDEQSEKHDLDLGNGMQTIAAD